MSFSLLSLPDGWKGGQSRRNFADSVPSNSALCHCRYTSSTAKRDEKLIFWSKNSKFRPKEESAWEAQQRKPDENYFWNLFKVFRRRIPETLACCSWASDSLFFFLSPVYQSATGWLRLPPYLAITSGDVQRFFAALPKHTCRIRIGLIRRMLAGSNCT